MHTGRLIVAQLMDFLPLSEFRRCVARYQSEHNVRGFSCLDQLLCLDFAQLAYRESLRDIFDRGHTDFARLYRITEALARFVIRGKRGPSDVRRDSRAVDKTTGLRSDQPSVRCGPKTATCPLVPLRRITYVDPDTRQQFVFLTTSFMLPALQIAQLYKCRWQIELFFKRIKQHFRIKAFCRTSVHAVQSPVWIAISVYALVAGAKKRLGPPQSHYTIPQLLSVTLLEKTPIHQAFAQLPDPTVEREACNQLSLFAR